MSVRRGAFETTLPVCTVEGTVKVSNSSPNTTRLSSLYSSLFSRWPGEARKITIHLFVCVLDGSIMTAHTGGRRQHVFHWIRSGTAVAYHSQVACIVGL